MHGTTSPTTADRIWLIAGTGEGPRLAAVLLEQGWRLRVSVVSRSAALAYPAHPGLEVSTGAIGGADPRSGVRAELERAAREGAPFRWVIDATHPFARRISPAVAEACRQRHQPLLRLARPMPPLGTAHLLHDLEDLGAQPLEGSSLLIALGARELATAVRLSPGARHHARILPRPDALRQAMAAGLRPERVACLQPGGSAEDDPAIERALCRRWRIEAVLCRRSGGPTEAQWQAVCGHLRLRLYLLDRPREPEHGEGLTLEALLLRLGHPEGLATTPSTTPWTGPP